MPFIGKAPETGAFRLIDSITTSATDTYALTVQGDHYFPASARNLIVSLNGVTQAPESAYTVSGSHIVFASALTANDVIDYILVIGDAVDIGTPSDGTVGNAQLKASLDFSGKNLTFSNDQISGDAIDGGTASVDTLNVGGGYGDSGTTIYSTGNISTNGNLTLGTLSVDGSALIQGSLLVDNGTLKVDNVNGRVGIGESNPSYLLDLKGGTNDSIRLNALSGAFIFANGSGADKGSLSMSGGNMDIAADAGIDFYSGGSPLSGDPQVALDSSGAVGIGTTTFNLDSFSSPTLAVGSAASGTRGTIEIASNLTYNTAYGLLAFTNASSTDTANNKRVAQITATRNGNNNAAELDFVTNDGSSFATRLKITASGNVGINYTGPDVPLCVGVNAGNTLAARFGTLGSAKAGDDVFVRLQGRSSSNSNKYFDIRHLVDDGALTINGPTSTLTEILRIDTDGIKFGGQTNAAHALDDYEEGTWSPEITNRTDSASAYTSQIGIYTKIGNVVYVHFDVEVSNFGSFTAGTVYIGNLPFVQSNHYHQGVVDMYGMAQNALGETCLQSLKNTDDVYILHALSTTGAHLALGKAYIDTGTRIRGALTYTV